MPTHEQPDHAPPGTQPGDRPTEMRGGRPYIGPDPLRHMPRRAPGRPAWGPPIVPGAGWQGEAPGGLPSEPGVGRVRQIVLTVLIVLVTISLVVFLIIYWNRDSDQPKSSGQNPANATQPADDSASEHPSDEPSDAADSDLPVDEITTSANEFYAQARAGEFDSLLDDSCADLAGDGAQGVDSLSAQYDDLLSWTVDDVQPGVMGEDQVAIVSATLRFAGSDAPNSPNGPSGPVGPGPGIPSLPGPGNSGAQVGQEAEDTLVFIDEDGWRYCGAG